MARSPVTRLQLDAYRFGQRRLESALARRDPVLLHEEIRTQWRVVLAGVALGMLGLLGALVYAKVAPAPSWQDEQIVLGKQSGRMFAVIPHPPRLVPVANLAAARLVRYAAVPDGSSATATPTEMDDAAFADAPRTATAAVPGAAAALPSGEDVPGGQWTLCDTGSRTVLVGASDPIAPLPAEEGLLVTDSAGRGYLVVNGRKHRIDAREALIAYGLRDVEARPVADAVLAGVPDGRPLRTVRVPDASEPSDLLPGYAVGDVVRVERPGGQLAHYLVLADGVQEIAEPVANLVRASLRADRSVPAPLVRAEQIDAVERASLPGLDDYPKVQPRLRTGDEAGAVCWQWAPNGHGGQLVAASAPPVPKGRSITELAQADGAAPRLDGVSLPATGALVACAVTDAEDAAACRSMRRSERRDNVLWLVAETGVGYPIASRETADALGIRAATPVPVDALRLLPSGHPLDVAEARRTVDVLMAAG